MFCYYWIYYYAENFKVDLRSDFISHKRPLLVSLPSSSRALDSHDSLFWQEFTAPDGPSITWLQTSPHKSAEPRLASPRLASETRLKPSDNNLPQFPPSHLHSRLPCRAPRSQPEIRGFGQKSTARSPAPRPVCFHNCWAKRSEQPVSSTVSTAERSRQKGSLRNGC